MKTVRLYLTTCAATARKSLLVACACLALLPATPVFAQDASSSTDGSSASSGGESPFDKHDLEAWIKESVWWDPYVNCGGGGGGGTTLAGGDNIAKAFNFFVSKGLSNEDAAAIVGNLMQESGVNPNAANTAGGTGGSIAQWEGDRWTKFLQFAKSSGKPQNDLGVQLEFMWAELNGTPPASKQGGLAEMKAASGIEAKTEAFEKGFERAGNPQMEKRIANAKKVLGMAKSGSSSGSPATTGGGGAASGGQGEHSGSGNASNSTGDTASGPTNGNGSSGSASDPAVTDSTNSSCGGTSGASSSKIVSKALELAWPTPHGTQNKPEYQQALANKAWNPSGNSGADCGVFVSVVMRSSGADPNYPPIGTSEQAQYVKTHGDKYQVMEKANSTADLKPGDILIVNAGGGAGAAGHTFIYLGPQQGGMDSASASLGDRSANLDKAVVSDNRGNYLVARLK